MKETSDVVSVIIPTYKRLSTLKSVLPSYINQKFVKEVIIVDDYSSDDTGIFLRELIRHEKKIKYFRNSKNMGAPFSRNKAISKATGKYIFIGEDDLELTDNYFEVLLKHMQKVNADIIAGRRIWMQKGETKQESLLRANRVKAEAFNKKLLTTNCEVMLNTDTELPLVDASMLIDKKVLRNVKYDKHYSGNAWREETDFQLSAYQQNYKLVYCPHAVSYHLFKLKNKGGNHAFSLLGYEWVTFKNNMYMARKHWLFLSSEFGINYLFYLRFISYRLKKLIHFFIADIVFIVKSNVRRPIIFTVTLLGTLFIHFCNNLNKVVGWFNGNYKGDIQIARYTTYGDPTRLKISISATVQNALFNLVSGTIVIEDNVFFGHNVCVLTGTHDYNKFGKDRIHSVPGYGRDIEIKTGAWIATNATITGPCVIGEHSVVAAGAVVTKDVEPYTIVAGVPAKLIKKINKN